MGSEGSCRQTSDPRNTKRIRGSGSRARGPWYSNPTVIRNDPKYMRRGWREGHAPYPRNSVDPRRKVVIARHG
ncbi:MAG: hypothetical protein DRQ39_11300 [Gammaproteobacteria bacterium]|nr:MAG: hypothetical protein DRQ39_11300 [Gammaproteobacteria bacterium]